MNVIINNPKHPYFLSWGKIVSEEKDTLKILIKDYEEAKSLDEFFSNKYKEIEIEVSVKDVIKITKKIKQEVPNGHYCYHGSRNPSDQKYKPCKYWGLDKTKPNQMNGYCTLLNCNDWDHDEILWDQCKSCGINDPD